MKILIYGIGNPYRCDDAVGIKVAQQLAERINQDTVDVKWGSIDGLAILDEIIGYDRALFIDSVKTKNGKPGDIYKINIASFRNMHSFSSHGIDFANALELGRKFNLEIPKTTEIYGIEIEDNETFSEKCTPSVNTAIPELVGTIKSEIDKALGKDNTPSLSENNEGL